MVYSVPMQSFEFEKALMQKHFNSGDFLNTKKFPKAKFVGKITNLSNINFTKDGTYPATASGELTIKDISKSVSEKGTILLRMAK
ncbi:MAG: YceI family protein [Bacteroidetes bacterium]|nr:YceI family protein [Bacteroidota bacterium]